MTPEIEKASLQRSAAFYGRVDAMTQVIGAMHAGQHGIGQPAPMYWLFARLMAVSFIVAILAFVLFAAFNTPH